MLVVKDQIYIRVDEWLYVGCRIISHCVVTDLRSEDTAEPLTLPTSCIPCKSQVANCIGIEYQPQLRFRSLRGRTALKYAVDFCDPAWWHYKEISFKRCPVAGCCEHGNEPSRSIQDEEFPDILPDIPSISSQLLCGSLLSSMVCNCRIGYNWH
jgi:hypothetical protein